MTGSAHTTIGTVRAASFDMDYIRFGSGSRAMVILPGMSIQGTIGSAQAVAEKFKVFTKTHTIYLLERKRGIASAYPIEAMADDTAAVLAELGVSDADVFGASQGGMIALVLAARYPELVHRLIVASTAVRPNAVSVDTMTTWKALAAAGDAVSLNRDVFRRVYSARYLETYRDAFNALEKVGTPEEILKYHFLADACLRFSFTDELPAIRCETLVLGAGDDLVFSADASLFLAQKLGCECVIYPGYGHAVYDEAPDFIDRIFRFFVK